MNQPRSIYRSDFGPHSWFENNFTSDVEEFCSNDNIDDCLKYLSQEFSALGYPSIYADPSSCPHSVNCDIVKLLNVIFELLKDFKEHVDSKEELDSRNHRLASDINVLNKKNVQLKERLEQTERKLNSSLERERQLKVKNEQLQSLLKSEKDESKKLSAQIQQQKVAFQREIRKNESNFTQMKNRLNQVLVDKNPEKKIASISTSHLLQRSSNQRGKWKTESHAKSSTDEMYHSVIMTYENRCQISLKEIEVHRQCFQFIEQQLEEIISFVEKDSYQKYLPCLAAILKGNNIEEELIKKFSSMFTQVQNIIANKVSENKFLSTEVTALKSKLLSLESNESFQEKTPELSFENHSHIGSTPNTGTICKSKEDKNMNESNVELTSLLAQIKEEKSKLESQKLGMIKSAMKQNPSNIPPCTKLVPSFCVVTTKNGVTSIPTTNQLKKCLSYPDKLTRSMSPLWKADLSALQESSPSSASTSVYEDSLSSPYLSFTSPQSLENDDLPNWARASGNISSPCESSVNWECFAEESDAQKMHTISSEEINLPTVKSSEEDNLAKLKAAVEDIENRRLKLYPTGKLP